MELNPTIINAAGNGQIEAGLLVGSAAAQVRISRILRTMSKGVSYGVANTLTAMSAPPTVTPGVRSAISTLNTNGPNSPSIKANDPRFFYTGASPIEASLKHTTGSASTSRTAGSVDYSAATKDGNLLEVIFELDAPVWELAQRLYSATLNLWVDLGDGKGFQTVSTSDFNASSDGIAGAANCFTKFDFGSRAWRRYKIILPPNNDFIGINLTASDTLVASPPQENRPWLTFGDSWVEGQGRVRQDGGFPSIQSRLLGFEYYLVSGVGGTGVLTPNTSITPNRVRWLDRLGDITSYNPIVADISLSINDNGKPLADMQAGIAQMVTTIQQALPDTVIFVTSPPNPSGNAPGDVSQKAWLAAAAAVADPLRTFVIDLWASTAPFNGSGSTGAPTGTGNADFYIGGTTGTDKSHMSAAGHYYYANLRAGAFRQRLQQMSVA